MNHTLNRLRAFAAWPVSSQQVARRNAMVACTALAERRRELLEVEEFLAAHTAAHTAAHRAARRADQARPA